MLISSRKSQKTIGLDINLTLIYRILIVYILYSIGRFAFYIYNIEHFDHLSFSDLVTIFKGGLLFDTSAIIYTNLLFIIGSTIPFRFRHNKTYQSVLKYVFIISNSIALLTHFADIPYFDFVLERTTINVFGEFKNESNMVALVFKFMIDYWMIVIAYTGVIFLLVYLYNRVKIRRSVIISPFVYYPFFLVVFLVVITLCVGGARGGFAHSTRPITLSNAGQFVTSPDEMALVLNTPFCLIRSTESKSYQRVKFYNSEDELEKKYSPIHYVDSTREDNNINIVIFVLESFNKEFIGSLNAHLDSGNYKGFTPFLDSLVAYSKTYLHSYANGRKSIDALPSVLASIPAVEHPFILSPYYNNRLNTLPGLLKEKGYKSALFHGAPNGSMGFKAFGQLAGVDEYYGKDEYNNDDDFDGMWGIWDEEFFQFFANTLDTFKTPFMATIFSVSSHHPFKVPPKHEGRFKMKDFPLQRVIEYTDYSLKRFFESASKMEWYDNTLFIFTADHVSLNQRPEFKNEIGYFSVPLIFHQPGSDLIGIDSTIVAQQIDIMPTILNYIGYDKDYVAFGDDLFNADSSKFAINHLNGTYRLFQGDYFLQFDGGKTIHMYNVKKDPLLQSDIVGQFPFIQSKMEHTVKAFIQQYKNRMIDNNLSLE